MEYYIYENIISAQLIDYFQVNAEEMTESEYHDIAKYGVIELAGRFNCLCDKFKCSSWKVEKACGECSLADGVFQSETS